jgi:hypothetical protein
MRAAEQAESPALRGQLARQGLQELIEAYATSLAPGPLGSEPLGGARPRSDAERLALIACLPGATRHAQAISALQGLDSTPQPSGLEYERLGRLFAWLEARIDARSAREVRLTRWFRCGALLALLATVAWLAIAPENVALGKQVSASSISSYTPAAPLGKDALYRVVDGRRREQSFAIHTENEPKPWIKVDLGKPYRIARVVVYPRDDCCFGEHELPLVVELSNDDQHFEIVARHTVPATVDFPWQFATPGRSARYVRLSTDAKRPRHIVIGELEVYGD